MTQDVATPMPYLAQALRGWGERADSLQWDAWFALVTAASAAPTWWACSLLDVLREDGGPFEGSLLELGARDAAPIHRPPDAEFLVHDEVDPPSAWSTPAFSDRRRVASAGRSWVHMLERRVRGMWSV